ncbi:ankyrin repeat domain-containing protein [bacterium SCSIO 12844]|nr:ankyrin repeat domain-containing protein [bacterium SCSIO 12844]
MAVITEVEKRRLFKAVQSNEGFDLVEKTILEQADIDETTMSKLLTCTIQRGHLDKIETLVKHGAGVNSRCPFSGRTPLVIAIKSHQNNAVEKLLDLGAKPFKRVNDNFPTAIARKCGNDKAAEILEKLELKNKQQDTVKSFSPSPLFYLGLAATAATIYALTNAI